MRATPLYARADQMAPPLDFARDALFFDLDGTLVEIESQPHLVVASGRTRDLLRRIAAASGGAVALLTGRNVAEADRVLGGAVACVAGLHGLERRISAEEWRARAEASPQMRALAEELLAATRNGTLNAIVEDKGASVALHYRHAPASEAHVRKTAEAAAAKHGFRTLEGKMVMEILPPGHGKGDALAELMREAPFAGRRPLAIGDDITDESAFAAANGLGGASVLVGAPRDTAARHRLASVAEVHDWLARALGDAA